MINLSIIRFDNRLIRNTLPRQSNINRRINLIRRNSLTTATTHTDRHIPRSSLSPRPNIRTLLRYSLLQNASPRNATHASMQALNTLPTRSRISILKPLTHRQDNRTKMRLRQSRIRIVIRARARLRRRPPLRCTQERTKITSNTRRSHIMNTSIFRLAIKRRLPHHIMTHNARIRLNNISLSTNNLRRTRNLLRRLHTSTITKGDHSPVDRKWELGISLHQSPTERRWAPTSGCTMYKNLNPPRFIINFNFTTRQH